MNQIYKLAWETWDRQQAVFDFYYDWNVWRDSQGRRPHGLTALFWA